MAGTTATELPPCDTSHTSPWRETLRTGLWRYSPLAASGPSRWCLQFIPLQVMSTAYSSEGDVYSFFAPGYVNTLFPREDIYSLFPCRWRVHATTQQVIFLVQLASGWCLRFDYSAGDVHSSLPSRWFYNPTLEMLAVDGTKVSSSLATWLAGSQFHHSNLTCPPLPPAHLSPPPGVDQSGEK